MLNFLKPLVLWSSLLVPFLLYPAAAYAVLRFAPARQRGWMFAVVNVLGAYATCATTLISTQQNVGPLLALMRVVLVGFAGYLVFLLVEFSLIRRSKAGPAWGITAFWFPIVVLIFAKYIPGVQSSFSGPLRSVEIPRLSALLLGLSYMTFRLCYLVQEVRNDAVETPTLTDYLSFCLFVPTLSLGPISPYSRYIDSYRQPSRTSTPVERSLLRILVGLTKYLFLSTLLNQYTYAGLLLDGHPHHKMDLVIALFAYTFYLYCNFSGFCDMAIGTAGLLGISVMENFNVPLLARNMQEFWNRWHISLSVWLREMMFTPLVKVLVRRFGPRSANHAIAFSGLAVFFIIGIWHGVGINYALFGIAQGIGLAVVHYYSVFLKRRLGKQGFADYRRNSVIHAAGVVLTFVFFSCTLFLFANSWKDMHTIFAELV